MRLHKEEIEYIKKVTKDCFGETAKVYLFGSRVDDSKRGGDIDLYIETDQKENTFETKIKMLVLLKEYLGDQKIDIVINNFKTERLIYQVARNEGIPLE